MIRMKKTDLVIAFTIVALILAGVTAGLAGCEMGLDGLDLGSESSTVDGGGVWIGDGTPCTPPAPAIAFSWDDAQTYGLSPWTGGEIAVPDGGSVTWKAFNAPPKAANSPTEARAKAVLTNAPAGYDYLQWSFDPTALKRYSATAGTEMEFGPQWSSSAPQPPATPDMLILWGASQTAKQVTIYVWNCDSAGNRGTASASFTVNVQAKPTIVLYWEWITLSSVGTLIPNDGDTIAWPGTASWFQRKEKIVRAIFTDAPSGYEYLQWSFTDPDTPPPLGMTSDGSLEFISGFTGPQANASTAFIRHDTNYGPNTGQEVWVYNVDSTGARPADPKLRYSAYFVLNATL